MRIYLQTDRIILREFTAYDHVNLLDLDSDPAVMKYLSDGKPTSVEENLERYERIKAVNGKHYPKMGFWMAFEKASGEFIGWFLFRPSKKDPENTAVVELGYRLKQKFWGKGYATEVSRAIIQKGLADPAVTEIFAITMKANQRSRNVMEKLGMTFSHEYQEDEFPGVDKTGVHYRLQRPLK